MVRPKNGVSLLLTLTQLCNFPSKSTLLEPEQQATQAAGVSGGRAMQ